MIYVGHLKPADNLQKYRKVPNSAEQCRTGISDSLTKDLKV